MSYRPTNKANNSWEITKLRAYMWEIWDQHIVIHCFPFSFDAVIRALDCILLHQCSRCIRSYSKGFSALSSPDFSVKELILEQNSRTRKKKVIRFAYSSAVQLKHNILLLRKVSAAVDNNCQVLALSVFL